MITQKTLKEVLHYNPDTGAFTWIKSNSPRTVSGILAGNKHYEGYIRISLNNKDYLAHRLAWLYMFGSMPKNQIDHINGNRGDNRISNLRESSRHQNQGNQRNPHSSNTSGFMGVYFDKVRNKFVATISINGKNKNLGRFKTPEEAHQVYLEAKRKHHEFCTI